MVYNVGMIKRYTMEEKPCFKDGDQVLVDMSVMGNTGLGLLKGKIVGKGMEHVIDFWLVEFEQTFPLYPFKVVSVIHTAIVKSMPIDQFVEALKK